MKILFAYFQKVLTDA